MNNRALSPVAGAAVAQEITGTARIIDGDTLEVAGQRIRIHGIDAPETRQLCSTGMARTACGKQATREMRELIAREPVRCEQRDVDRFGRIVAVCFNDDGDDIGSALVAQGWALAYRQFSLDYVDEETEARESERGMWRGTFVAPWDYRRGGGPTLGAGIAPDAAEIPDTAADPDGACLIKGNISSRGGEATGQRHRGGEVNQSPGRRPGGSVIPPVVCESCVIAHWCCENVPANWTPKCDNENTANRWHCCRFGNQSTLQIIGRQDLKSVSR